MQAHDKITPLYSAEQVRRRLDELARCLDEDYRGRETTLVGVLNGGRTLTEEMARRLRVPFMLDYVKAASYGGATRPAQPVRVEMCLRHAVRGRHVLLLDDIADTGQTLAAVTARLLLEEPASLRVFVLANKPLRRIVGAPLDYVAFTVPDKFIVGCGLCRGEEFRDLPFLGYLNE